MTAPAVEYVSLDETLKRMKAELKREFPGVVFSVRRARGTGYGYVSLGWTDGPSYEAVTSIAHMYQGEGFDGMTDSSYGITHVAADGQGNPVRIRYGTRGINCSHHITDSRVVAMCRTILTQCREPKLPDAERDALLGMTDDRAFLDRACYVQVFGRWLSAFAREAIEHPERFGYLSGGES